MRFSKYGCYGKWSNVVKKNSREAKVQFDGNLQQVRAVKIYVYEDTKGSQNGVKFQNGPEMG